MIRLLLSAVLMSSLSVASADIGLFFNGTQQFGKTGIIQAEFPNLPLLSCSNVMKCVKKSVDHYVFFSVYSTDVKKMKAAVEGINDGVFLTGPVAKISGNDFVVTLHDGSGYSGYYAMIGVKMPKKSNVKITKARRTAITKAIRDMMIKAYDRLDSGKIKMDSFYFTETELAHLRIKRRFPQVDSFGETSRYNPASTYPLGEAEYLYAWFSGFDKDGNRIGEIDFLGTFDSKGVFLSPLKIEPAQQLHHPALSFLEPTRNKILSFYPTAFYFYYVSESNKYQIHDQCNRFLGAFEPGIDSVSLIPIASTRPPSC